MIQTDIRVTQKKDSHNSYKNNNSKHDIALYCHCYCFTTAKRLGLLQHVAFALENRNMTLPAIKESFIMGFQGARARY